jgi:hypothetical protein
LLQPGTVARGENAERAVALAQGRDVDGHWCRSFRSVTASLRGLAEDNQSGALARLQFDVGRMTRDVHSRLEADLIGPADIMPAFDNRLGLPRWLDTVH